MTQGTGRRKKTTRGYGINERKQVGTTNHIKKVRSISWLYTLLRFNISFTDKNMSVYTYLQMRVLCEILYDVKLNNGEGGAFHLHNLNK